jgi:hypothetical protein
VSKIIRINPVEVNSSPNDSRVISRGVPCKCSIRLIGPGDHLGDFNTYFEAIVFATRYAAENDVKIDDRTRPAQRI